MARLQGKRRGVGLVSTIIILVIIAIVVALAAWWYFEPATFSSFWSGLGLRF